MRYCQTRTNSYCEPRWALDRIMKHVDTWTNCNPTLNGAKHSALSFHLGAPFGPSGPFFTNLVFWLKNWFRNWVDGAKHPPLSFHQGAPFGPFGPFFTHLFFDFKADFRIELIPRDRCREMIHPKEYVEVWYGSNFNFGECEHPERELDFSCCTTDKWNYFELSFLITNSST